VFFTPLRYVNPDLYININKIYKNEILLILIMVKDDEIIEEINVQKITIISYPFPKINNVNDELQWIGNSLGLFNLRDKDKSQFRIFIELLKAAKSKIPISSDEVAEILKLSRGTVVHHLNKMISNGLIVTKNNKYILRVDNLNQLVTELERDVNDIINEIKRVANDIDRKLGI
jgi:predicted transcriptional regulator